MNCLLRGDAGGFGRFPVPLGCVRRVARGVEETGLEQQGIGCLPERERAVDGAECTVLVAVPPVDVGDRQVMIGPFLRGLVPILGEHADAPDGEVDAAVVENRLVVER